VVLPEALDLGWTHSSARSEADTIPGGQAYERLAGAARLHGVHVCSGLTERAGERVYNAAVLIGPDGCLLSTHRKLNELEIGHACYDQGDRLGVVDTELGRIGVMICADAFARDEIITRTLGWMGADVIVSPSAWAVPPDHDQEREPYGQLWRDCYGRVARDFRLWIAGVSQVGLLKEGPWAGRRCIGCSLLVSPGGAVHTQGPYGVGADVILYANISPEPRPARGDVWNTRLV
jgi:predicted amidohydrolase